MRSGISSPLCTGSMPEKSWDKNGNFFPGICAMILPCQSAQVTDGPVPVRSVLLGASFLSSFLTIDAGGKVVAEKLTGCGRSSAEC